MAKKPSRTAKGRETDATRSALDAAGDVAEDMLTLAYEMGGRPCVAEVQGRVGGRPCGTSSLKRVTTMGGRPCRA